MLVITGLGNPGKDYADTRHNIGFMAIDSIYARGGFSPWKEKFKALIAEGIIDGQKVLLVKPQTFVNNSGEALQPLMQFYKLQLGDIMVFHDDMDLAPGKIRIKTGGSSGGHNGLKSIEAHCGKDYQRVRLGIGHPEHDHETVVNFVLGKFPAADHSWIDPLIAAIGKEISLLIAGDTNGFMNKIYTETHNAAANNGHTAADKQPAAKAAKAAAQPARPAPAAGPQSAFAEQLSGLKLKQPQ